MADGGDRQDDSEEKRWMTYAELAQARRIKEPAAVRLVQRQKWQREPGNDGATRVAVPISAIRPSLRVIPAVSGVAPDIGDDGNLALERLRAVQAEARADRAETREAEARGEAKQLQQERDAARQEREDARVNAAAAEGEIKALREALTEARRPAWRRWIGLP